MINKYIHVPYVNGGRDIKTGLDCYGLTRLIRNEAFGRPLMPLLNGLDADDKGDVTLSYAQLVGSYKEVELQQGAIACAFLGKRLMHIGAVVDVDGRTKIIETNKNTGVTLSSPAQFAAHYTVVKYYDD